MGRIFGKADTYPAGFSVESNQVIKSFSPPISQPHCLTNVCQWNCRLNQWKGCINSCKIPPLDHIRLPYPRHVSESNDVSRCISMNHGREQNPWWLTSQSINIYIGQYFPWFKNRPTDFCWLRIRGRPPSCESCCRKPGAFSVQYFGPGRPVFGDLLNLEETNMGTLGPGCLRVTSGLPGFGRWCRWFLVALIEHPPGESLEWRCEYFWGIP